ncbi:MAG: ParB/RepB/Spo0J family partition protein [Acidobacteria bacterium]|nr:ParB/RepB/Spo0J family partition protein [Acidobacteriota bacterium]
MTNPPNRRALGRGLGALIPNATAKRDPGPAPSGLRTIAIEALIPNPDQPRKRFAEGPLRELAESLKNHGILQPLVVAPVPGSTGEYTIIAGERRWRASQLAGLEEVPVFVREVSGDQELLELALVENVQRTDLNPVEEAEAYRALQDTFGLSQEQVAQRVGKARTTITNGLRLLRLAPEIQDLLRSGRLTAGQARPLLALADAEAQIALARRAVAEGLSARQLEALTSPQPETSKKPAKPPQPPEVHAAAAAEKLTRHLQTPVEIKRRGKGGIVAIRFHSEEELMRLYDVLMERGNTP